MRVTFLQKVLGLLFLLTAGAIVLSNLTFSLTARRVLIQGIGAEAIELALQARGQLDAGRYEALLAGRLDRETARREFTEELQAIQARLGAHGVENLYVLAPVGDGLYVVSDSSGDDLPLAVKDAANVAIKRGVLESGLPASTPQPYHDAYGTWISGYVPVRGASGKNFAVLGADLPVGAFPLIHEITRKNTLVSLAPALVFALLAGLFFSRRLTEPIRQLTAGLRKVQGGDYGGRVEIASGDEIGQMSEAFNAMTRELAEKERVRSALHQAVSKEVAEALLRGALHAEGEVREATVLFTDIRGFTALSETLSAREVITLLNAYLGVMAPLVSKHGGVVDKFVGDEIMAVFGAPLELADDALAAVACALEMREALGAFNRRQAEEGRPEIGVGFGVNTGVVVAGLVGSSERQNYTVLGSTVNAGSRLCSLAVAGQVLASQNTYLRCKGRVEAVQMPPLSAKGISFPMTVFEVRGLKGAKEEP
jgi:class 3 adenylate cyclase